MTAINGTLIPTYAARGAHRPLDDLIAADPDFDLDDFYQPSRCHGQRSGSSSSRRRLVHFDVLPAVNDGDSNDYAEVAC